MTEPDHDVLKRARLFEPMIRSEAWAEYIKVMQSHVAGFTNLALNPAKDLFGLVQAEGQKGIVAGLKLALDVPKIAAEEAQRIRKKQGDTFDD